MPSKKKLDQHIIDEMVKLRLEGRNYSQITRAVIKKGISISQPTVKKIVDENIKKPKSEDPENHNIEDNADKEQLSKQEDLSAIMNNSDDTPIPTTNSKVNNEDSDNKIEEDENGKNAHEDNQNEVTESELLVSPVTHEETKLIKDTSINNDDDVTMLLYSIIQQVGSVNKKVITIETKLTKQNPYTTITKQADDFFEIYAGKRKSITLNLSEKLLGELTEFARTRYGIKRNVSDAVNLALLIALYGYRNR